MSFPWCKRFHEYLIENRRYCSVCKDVLNRVPYTTKDDSTGSIILKTAVEREKAVQAIDVHRNFKNCVVTFWVMSQFLKFLGASRGCADFRDPTAVFRIIETKGGVDGGLRQLKRLFWKDERFLGGYLTVVYDTW